MVEIEAMLANQSTADERRVAAGKIMAAYPNGQPKGEQAKAYLGLIGEALKPYPSALVNLLGDMQHGFVKEHKYFPSIHDITSWLDATQAKAEGVAKVACYMLVKVAQAADAAEREAAVNLTPAQRAERAERCRKLIREVKTDEVQE